MDSILKNILSNALKYTPRGGVSRSVPSRTGMYGVWKWKTRGLAFHPRNGRNCSGNHFEGSNAVNLQVAGNGVGLMMVHRAGKAARRQGPRYQYRGEGDHGMCYFSPRSRRLDKACPVASPRKQDTGKTRMGPDCGTHA